MSGVETKTWDNHIWDRLEAGQRFSRVRGFRLADKSDFPDDGGPTYAGKWWLVGPTHTMLVTARGLELVEIVETVPTETVGALALYRQWLIDPEGREIDSPWFGPRRRTLLYRPEVRLRGSLNQMGFMRDQRPALRVVA
jgi:hypothetical protein